MCCLTDDDIVVTIDSDDSKVIVYNREGKVRWTFDGIELKYPYKVAVNKVNQDICICHQKTDRWYFMGEVKAIGADGKLHFEYSGNDRRRFRPVGVCTDQMGHVLITDYYYHRVHILDQEGQFIQDILYSDEERFNSYSLDVDEEGYVWVGENKSNATKARVKVARYLH